MKNIVKFSALILIGWLSSCVPPQQEAPDEYTEVSNQEFYDQLSPYGHWIQRPDGVYVWIPEAGPDFVPYSTNGYWVWTDSYGWTWASDYSWGWAPFHYGRWDYDDGYGWFWVPDHVWGPAWVCWRGAPGYYGWCPLRPGISIDIALSGGYDPGDRWWTGCDGKYFGSRDMRNHFDHDREHTGRIRGGESRVIGNAPDVGGGRRGFVTGPPRQQVEAVAHAPIQVMKLSQTSRPGESITGNTLNIYRPESQRIISPRGPQVQQTQPVQNNSAPRSQPTQTQPSQNNGTVRNQQAPRSVTTPQDIHDLHEQARPPSERQAAPPREQPRQNAPAPRERAAPRQAPPQQHAPQQSAPRSNPRSQGEGRPK